MAKYKLIQLTSEEVMDSCHITEEQREFTDDEGNLLIPDAIVLTALDEETNEPMEGGQLFALSQNGYLLRFPRVNPELGYTLDEEGRIEYSS